jgi:hypothetical protein
MREIPSPQKPSVIRENGQINAAHDHADRKPADCAILAVCYSLSRSLRQYPFHDKSSLLTS